MQEQRRPPHFYFNQPLCAVQQSPRSQSTIGQPRPLPRRPRPRPLPPLRPPRRPLASADVEPAVMVTADTPTVPRR